MKLAVRLLPILWLATAVSARAADNPHDLPDGLYSEVTTPRGVVVCELFFKKVPMTVANYVGLAEGTLGPKKGTPFYDGLKFHRVVPEFVVQGGSGGRIGYSFPDEIVPGLRHDSVGVVQMANGGPDTNGSQWCMMLNPTQRLNYLHTVFGHVVRGIELLPKIEQGDSMHVKILRLGTDAQAFKADEATFNALVAKAKKYTGPRAPGPDTFFDDPDKVLPTNIARALHFTQKLANFERFTGKRIVARVFARAPDNAEGAKLDEYVTALATRMGVAQSGALAVYLADQNRWIIRVGLDSAADFIAGPRKPDGTKAPVSPGKTLEQAVPEFLASAKPVPANPMDPPGQRVKLLVDAVLDELVFRLEPAAK
jgi:cyclophilin family peptidyl-prolyl cis-trans isomerase